jgi:hypothetical protein
MTQPLMSATPVKKIIPTVNAPQKRLRQAAARGEHQQATEHGQRESDSNGHVNRAPPGCLTQYRGPLLETAGRNRMEDETDYHQQSGKPEHVAAGPGRAHGILQSAWSRPGREGG